MDISDGTHEEWHWELYARVLPTSLMRSIKRVLSGNTSCRTRATPAAPDFQ